MIDEFQRRREMLGVGVMRREHVRKRSKQFRLGTRSEGLLC